MKSLVIFRGREIVHSEIGREILNRLAAELGEVALVEVPPRQEGNTMVQILAPKKEAAPRSSREAEKEATAERRGEEGGGAEEGRRSGSRGGRAPTAREPSEDMRKPKKKLQAEDEARRR